MSWKVLSTKDVYVSKWMRVTEDELETDHGKRLTYNVLHRDDFALVIPWDGERFVLVGQYRYPVDKYSWEFPMGSSVDHAMDQVAVHELKEETGMTAEIIKPIGTYFVANGHCTQTCYAYVATELKEGEQELEPGEEGMQVKRVTPAELKQMIAEGEIKDGPTISAFCLLLTSGWLDKQSL